jgi:hypothetical protein
MENNKNYIINIILGLVVGIILGLITIPRKKYVGPYSGNIQKRKYKCTKTKKCYKLVPEIYVCPLRYTIMK